MACSPRMARHSPRKPRSSELKPRGNPGRPTQHWTSRKTPRTRRPFFGPLPRRFWTCSAAKLRRCPTGTPSWTECSSFRCQDIRRTMRAAELPPATSRCFQSATGFLAPALHLRNPNLFTAFDADPAAAVAARRKFFDQVATDRNGSHLCCRLAHPVPRFCAYPQGG